MIPCPPKRPLLFFHLLLESWALRADCASRYHHPRFMDDAGSSLFLGLSEYGPGIEAEVF